MTGKEFCNILGIDYDNIVEKRKDDTSDNFNYVVEKCLKLRKFVHNFQKCIVDIL